MDRGKFIIREEMWKDCWKGRKGMESKRKGRKEECQERTHGGREAGRKGGREREGGRVSFNEFMGGKQLLKGGEEEEGVREGERKREKKKRFR